MLERRRDLSSIPVRESCSKARGEQKRGGGGGMEASIRGHGARHRTGSLSLSLAPLPLPTRLSGVFPPFCSSCTALLSLGGLLIGIETPPKPPRLLLARLIHFLPPCAHPLFAFSHPHPTVYSQRSCALFRFLPPRLLRVMYIIDENCPRKDAISHRIETERDCHGLSRFSNDSFLLSSSTKREQSRLSRNF